MKTSINKVGGANMGRPAEVVEMVRAELDAGHAPVLVVSALKGQGKLEQTTDMLVRAADGLDDLNFQEADIDSAFAEVLDYHQRYIDEHFKGDFAQQA
ncbi:MAG: hypothetical protein OEY44_04420, partial [Candidatus Peregrinibacteria bacterium]|nr:hypothetical protein [Candidatus Peregrinibacteria bacterium]